MPDLLQLSLESWAFFLLIFARVLAIFAVAPIFGGRNVPGTVRLSLAGSLAFLFSLTVPPPPGSIFNSFFALLPVEILVGLAIGYISMLFFNALQMAGSLIDIPMGFSMVNVFDPNTDTQLPIMGDFYYVLAMLLFLATNAHHLLLAAILESYQWFAVGQNIQPLGLVAFVQTFTRFCLIGVRVAIPVVGVMLMSDAALALLARTVPSLNAFILGVPIKIIFGVTTMLFCLAAYITFTGNLFHNSESGMVYEIFNFLGLIGGGR
ncbi:MAG: flagellar biosynthetic protein FliR [Symbiobacteriaceae bacterium]|nr:flagellar biosynthetic protein FliR [Symbiobacteriaceae bacterium]